MMSEPTTKQSVCLDFGGAYCTYIEVAGDHLDEEEYIISWFEEKILSGHSWTTWAENHLTVIFDGQLDQPEKFKSIKATGIYGPKLFEINNGSALLSGFSVYLDIVSEDELSEEDIEDLFHMIIPVIHDSDTIVAFTEFEDYSVLFERQDDSARLISVDWTSSS
jgi:hypothetical protein